MAMLLLCIKEGGQCIFWPPGAFDGLVDVYLQFQLKLYGVVLAIAEATETVNSPWVDDG
jgi:hypothetical protein